MIHKSEISKKRQTVPENMEDAITFIPDHAEGNAEDFPDYAEGNAADLPDNTKGNTADFPDYVKDTAAGSSEPVAKAASVTPDQKEQAEHGDIFLPVNSYHCKVPDTYTELALHWHEEMEVTLIISGVSDYRVGQQQFQARAGDLIIVPPFTLHSAMEIPGEEMVSDSLVFHLDFLGAAGQDLSALQYLRPLSQGQMHMTERMSKGSSCYEEIRRTFLGALSTFQEKNGYYELFLKEQLLHLIYLLFAAGYVKDSAVSGAERENKKQFQKVLRYIGEHYQEPITISHLADVSGFSESYFMSIFKQNAGMTCVKYINSLRIHKAAEDLEKTDHPVMEVAMDHGFDNISYFNRQFRRSFGMTPREFRMIRWQKQPGLYAAEH